MLNWLKATGLVVGYLILFAMFMGIICGIAYLLAFYPLYLVGTAGAIALIWNIWRVKRDLDEDSERRAASKKEWDDYLAEQKEETRQFDERLQEARRKLKELEDEYAVKDQ